MQLNADFSRRAVVHAGTLDWVASPMAGVHRRMLDRIGDEIERATSIVRYAHLPAISLAWSMTVVRSSWCWTAYFRMSMATILPAAMSATRRIAPHTRFRYWLYDLRQALAVRAVR